MTREEILNHYDVDTLHNPPTILSQGKFEAEPIWAPYFYDLMMNGRSDNFEYREDSELHIFSVLDVDRQEFPELASVESVELVVSNNGFVLVTSK